MDLKPSPALKSRYRLLAILIFVICVFSWSIPLALFIPLDYQAIYHLSVHLPTAVALVYTLWWIPRFYGTLSYEIDEERGLVTSRSGVFWKSERRVNIPKVNMVHTTEGPLQRHYGTKHLHIHTAAMGRPRLKSFSSI
jgi:membrane protein YdbS with pleckstrin-like domain